MALNKTTLKTSIKAIFEELKTYDGSAGKTQADAMEKLATDLADAIDTYVKSADVSVSNSGTLTPGTLVSANPGVATVHVPPSGAPFTSTGTGSLS